MDREHLAVLADAVKTQQRKEELEKAVGRASRRAEKTFEFYLEIVSELRELAISGKTSVEEAAKSLLAEHDNGGDEGN